MKNLIYISIFLGFTECMSIDQIRTQNRKNLTLLSIGISKTEVLDLMGNNIVRTTDGTRISNPWKSEILKSENGEYYEVLFYYTDIKIADGIISNDELTPILLKDNRLLGWGWSFLLEKGIIYHDIIGER